MTDQTRQLLNLILDRLAQNQNPLVYILQADKLTFTLDKTCESITITID